MRPCILLLAVVFAGCFSDSGPPEDEPTTTGTSTTTDPTTGEDPGPRCGDGVQQAGEICDDGDANGQYAACNDACNVNICGDGVRGPAEQCDDGDADENNSCTSKCAPPRCGDGIVHMGEMCDDANTDETDTCTSRCMPPACGDGVVSEPEQCDLGETLNKDVGHCTKLCMNKACGDGFVQPGEACDPGVDPPEAPCTAECLFDMSCGDGMAMEPEVCDPMDPMGPACTPICTVPACGDGIVSIGEACDDGNVVDGDDCTTNCTESICGDNKIAGDEECDDGNTGAGDACGATCLRDTRYVFVSSLRYAAGAIGTVGYADMQCQMLAAAALLPGTYRAWLSNGAVSPATRFSKSLDRAYVLPKSVQSGLAKKVANDWVDLVDGTLIHEINVTEKGEELTSSLSCEIESQMAWTATSRSAGPFDMNTHCNQWTTSVGTAHGVAGLIGSTGVKWTEGCPEATCDLKARLYCFEQP